MKKSRKPAGNRKGAWLVQEKEFGARYFGTVPEDRLDLEEDTYGLAGRMKLMYDFSPEEITGYVRTLDEKTGMIHTSYQWQGHQIETMVFASVKENLVFFEISADELCLNLTAAFQPELKNAYLNYNMGGFYFETKKRKALLIGKGELKTDGFPKADENGIHIKNASKVAFRIFMKSESPRKGTKTMVQATEMQMAMNRYLAGTDDISREALIRFQENRDVF